MKAVESKKLNIYCVVLHQNDCDHYGLYIQDWKVILIDFPISKFDLNYSFGTHTLQIEYIDLYLNIALLSVSTINEADFDKYLRINQYRSKERISYLDCKELYYLNNYEKNHPIDKCDERTEEIKNPNLEMRIPNVKCVIDINGMILGLIRKENFASNSDSDIYYWRDLEVRYSNYFSGSFIQGYRCFNCDQYNYIDLADINNTICGHCEIPINLNYSSFQDDIQEFGINSVIEKVIDFLGYDVRESRKGINNWSVKNNRTVLTISYYEKKGVIVCDVLIGRIQDNTDDSIFSFLLKQNYILNEATFSYKDQNIYLSSLIYDQLINENNVKRVFLTLLSEANRFDNLLVEKFELSWN